MGLQWFGNPDWYDDHPPTSPVPVQCQGCKQDLVWHRPVAYNGPPPKCECGGEVKERTE